MYENIIMRKNEMISSLIFNELFKRAHIANEIYCALENIRTPKGINNLFSNL
jgi:hypothetical protein